MTILLIIYILFLLAYMVFNAYVIFRVNKMRLKGDLTNRGMFVYFISIAVVLAISLIFMSTLNWGMSLTGGRLGL